MGVEVVLIGMLDVVCGGTFAGFVEGMDRNLEGKCKGFVSCLSWILDLFLGSRCDDEKKKDDIQLTPLLPIHLCETGLDTIIVQSDLIHCDFAHILDYFSHYRKVKTSMR